MRPRILTPAHNHAYPLIIITRARHTAASLMIQAGYPPKMLQEIMGHASLTTTLDLYGHLYPGEMDRYADRLDNGGRGS